MKELIGQKFDLLGVSQAESLQSLKTFEAVDGESSQTLRTLDIGNPGKVSGGVYPFNE